MDQILIFGAGGHAKVVYDIVTKQGRYEVAAFPALIEAASLFGKPVTRQADFTSLKINKGLIAIGDNVIREQVQKLILEKNPAFEFVTAIHPSAQIGLDVKIGAGTVIMANVTVNPCTTIGEHVIVNTGSNIDHDCVLQNFSSIAPGATLGGNVKIGAYTAISLGAHLVHNINIGEHTIIGAGSTVLGDIGRHQLAFGVPCKTVRSRQPGEKYL